VTFRYRVVDSSIPGGSAEADVTLTIAAPIRPSSNTPPVATPDVYVVAPGDALTVPAGPGGILSNDQNPNVGLGGARPPRAREWGRRACGLADPLPDPAHSLRPLSPPKPALTTLPPPLPFPLPFPPLPAGQLVVTGIARPPAEGTIVAWFPNGTFIWQPPPNFSGTTTFDYT
jgi:hypothetical protein